MRCVPMYFVLCTVCWGEGMYLYQILRTKLMNLQQTKSSPSSNLQLLLVAGCFMLLFPNFLTILHHYPHHHDTHSHSHSIPNSLSAFTTQYRVDLPLVPRAPALQLVEQPADSPSPTPTPTRAHVRRPMSADRRSRYQHGPSSHLTLLTTTTTTTLLYTKRQRHIRRRSVVMRGSN